MSQNQFKILLGLMSVALLGLLLLQVFWIRNVHNATETRFNEQVMESMEGAVNDLERLEALGMMQPELIEKGIKGSYADFVNAEFNEVMRVDETIEIRDTVITQNGEKYRFLVLKGTTIDTVTGLLAEHRVITKDAGAIIPSDFGNLVLTSEDSNAFAIELNNSFEKQILSKARFINELMVKMFNQNYFDDITLRVNLPILDSILTRNFIRNKIESDFTFAIADSKGKFQMFPDSMQHYRQELDKSNFYTDLFPSDIATSHYQLMVNFPKGDIYVWKEMAGTLIASLLLLIIVVFAFYMSVSTIYRQKQLSEIKNDFISNMTHELKTPISTISLACEAIKDPDVANDEASLNSFVGMIDQENKRLGKLVENVLQTALLEKGKITLKKNEIRLDKLVRDIVDSFQIRANERSGKVEVVHSDPIIAEVDRIHFGNIVYNLLDNAIKYAQKKPVVQIGLKEVKSGFELTVTDNGIGIKKEDHKRIFEKLYRVPTGDVHNVKGFGLGLNYVHSIVTLHNGIINVDSSPGKGSIFKIVIKNE